MTQVPSDGLVESPCNGGIVYIDIFHSTSGSILTIGHHFPDFPDFFRTSNQEKSGKNQENLEKIKKIWKKVTILRNENMISVNFKSRRMLNFRP